MRKDRRITRGQSLVEFALILPVFIILLVGIFDVGRLIYAYNTVNNSAREAARLAIVDQTVSNIEDEAAEAAAGLGIDTADIDVSFVNNASGAACGALIGTDRSSECSAVVLVPYEYQAVTPLLGTIFGTLTVTGESQFRVEANCVEPTAPVCPLGS
ncbi:MAG: TadE/TadG family type IV pilus assembly protein [Vicinamibacterales bacterium]